MYHLNEEGAIVLKPFVSLVKLFAEHVPAKAWRRGAPAAICACGRKVDWSHRAWQYSHTQCPKCYDKAANNKKAGSGAAKRRAKVNSAFVAGGRVDSAFVVEGAK